jgi:aldehyde dehydrogenase (NAD+)
MDILSPLNINKESQGASTGTKWIKTPGDKIDSFSPVDGKLIGTVSSATKDNYEAVVKAAEQAFPEWRMWPAPNAEK